MRTSLIALVGLLTLAPAALAAPSGTPARRAASPRCAALQADYENASKSLAANFAEAVGDNSAVRATMRESQDGNTLSQARMTMDLMRANGCRVPAAAPNAGRYVLSAMKCKNDELDAQLKEIRGGDVPAAPPVSCDQSKWVPGRSGG